MLIIILLIAFSSLAFAQKAVVASQNNSDAPSRYEVVLHDEAPYFTPKKLRVPIGSTVIWHNQGPALVHTIIIKTDSGVSRSGAIFPGKTWSYTFRQRAVIKTACGNHPYMYGFVIAGEVPEETIEATTSGEMSRLQAVKAEILEFPLPVPNAVPGIIEVDEQDNAWFTMGGGGWGNITYPPLDMVGRLSLQGDFDQYRLPTKGSGPSGLTISPEGIVYATELMGGRIAKLDWNKKVVEEFPIPTDPAWPTGLDFDSRGNLWFSITRGNKIGSLSPEGKIREFPMPTPNAHPTGLAVDAQDNIWVSERDAGKIACLRADGTFVEYAIPTPKAKPAGIAVDEEGRAWFAEREGNAIGVLENGVIREYALPNPTSGPFFIRIDHHGNIWFSETYGNRIGVLDPRDGSIVEYDVPTRDSWPGGVAIDSQGNVWFTEQLGNKVGVLINPSQKMSHAAGSH